MHLFSPEMRFRMCEVVNQGKNVENVSLEAEPMGKVPWFTTLNVRFFPTCVCVRACACACVYIHKQGDKECLEASRTLDPIRRLRHTLKG